MYTISLIVRTNEILSDYGMFPTSLPEEEWKKLGEVVELNDLGDAGKNQRVHLVRVVSTPQEIGEWVTEVAKATSVQLISLEVREEVD